MINSQLQEFADDVVNRGRINFGDVRRLQRVCLPGGLANGEELEVLISLNTKLVQADRAWAQWLVAAVVDFVIRHEESGHPIKDTVSQSVAHLLATSATNLGRTIARQIRRALAKPRAAQSPRAQDSHPECSEVRQAIPVATLRTDADARPIRVNVGTTDRIVVRPAPRCFDVIAPIPQFPIWSAPERYQIGRFSTGHRVGDVLAAPCRA
jgi:hypothetical protein